MWAAAFVGVSIERHARRRIILCCASPCAYAGRSVCVRWGSSQ